MTVEVDAQAGVEYEDINFVDGHGSVAWEEATNEIAVGVFGFGTSHGSGLAAAASRMTPDQADELAAALTAAATKARNAEVTA